MVLPSFTIESFLRSLFANSCAGYIESIDPKILQAHVNFLMFSSTSEHLSGASFHKLCYTLLRRSTALQLAPGQPLYNLFIAFYWGDPEKPYNLAEAGAILVKVRNEKEESSPDEELNETFYNIRAELSRKRRRTSSKKNSNFIFNHRNAKLLYIRLDPGVDEPSLNVSHSASTWPKIWAIHCIGHD